ncbi:MAG: hypothetical protein R3C26_07935 [Calditrichia bacterium]
MLQHRRCDCGFVLYARTENAIAKSASATSTHGYRRYWRWKTAEIILLNIEHKVAHSLKMSTVKTR